MGSPHAYTISTTFLVLVKLTPQNLEVIIQTCRNLGIPLAPEKVEGPVEIIDFLGIEVDTKRMVLRLPEEKVVRLQQLVLSGA